MLIDGPDDVYMIDRDNAVFKVPTMRFPRRKDLTANISETLLDGVWQSLTRSFIALTALRKKKFYSESAVLNISRQQIQPTIGFLDATYQHVS